MNILIKKYLIGKRKYCIATISNIFMIETALDVNRGRLHIYKYWSFEIILLIIAALNKIRIPVNLHVGVHQDDKLKCFQVILIGA